MKIRRHFHFEFFGTRPERACCERAYRRLPGRENIRVRKIKPVIGRGDDSAALCGRIEIISEFNLSHFALEPWRIERDPQCRARATVDSLERNRPFCNPDAYLCCPERRASRQDNLKLG